jgi:hypothetical protein
MAPASDTSLGSEAGRARQSMGMIRDQCLNYMMITDEHIQRTLRE